MIGTLQFNEESEQYLFAAVLRPGNAHGSHGAIGSSLESLRDCAQPSPKPRSEYDSTAVFPLRPSFFKANQFRVFLTAAAYALMQEIRRQARRLGRTIRSQNCYSSSTQLSLGADGAHHRSSCWRTTLNACVLSLRFCPLLVSIKSTANHEEKGCLIKKWVLPPAMGGNS
jgi:hypothetical protein